MRYIIAGNYLQFEQHCRAEKYRYSRHGGIRDVDAIYISGPDACRGRQLEEGDTVEYVGTYYDRKDFDEIMKQVHFLEAIRNR